MGQRFDEAAYRELIRHAEVCEDEQRWLFLEAAHVVGQRHFKSHLETHMLMLRLALSSRDWREAVGQVLRLAFVPLGHLTGRLPTGNPGRANVSAFLPLAVRPELAELIARASKL